MVTQVKSEGTGKRFSLLEGGGDCGTFLARFSRPLGSRSFTCLHEYRNSRTDRYVTIHVYSRLRKGEWKISNMRDKRAFIQHP